jgi:hypothetical protein
VRIRLAYSGPAAGFPVHSSVAQTILRFFRCPYKHEAQASERVTLKHTGSRGVPVNPQIHAKLALSDESKSAAENPKRPPHLLPLAKLGIIPTSEAWRVAEPTRESMNLPREKLG